MNPFHSLGITSVPSKYVVHLPSKGGGGSVVERRCVLAAHVTWIRELVSTRGIPATFLTHHQLTEDEVQAFLNQRKSAPLGPHWMFLLLTVMKCPRRPQAFYQLQDSTSPSQASPSPSPKTKPRGGSGTPWPQVVDFVGEANFNFIWEQPQINVLAGKGVKFLSSTGVGWDKPVVKMDTHSYLHALLRSMYIHLDQPMISEEKKNDSVDAERFPISNLSQALSLITIPNKKDSSSHEDVEYFLMFHPYLCFNLYDAVTFSPQKLSSTNRQMFIVYQILNFLRDVDIIRLPLGNLTLRDFQIDECLYLSVVPRITEILEQLKSHDPQAQELLGDPVVLDSVRKIVGRVKGWDISEDDGSIKPEFVETVIRYWCEGFISNYDYLMFLNFLCGRFCNGNPNLYPVFPWVSDLSSPMGGWRDFTKSKFRLNKGDRQLDIMYEEIGTAEKTVAHHVSDILSEITYYVYKARRTQKEVLCRFVRKKWEPGEYPGSIARMQDWTPDECIPEFFDDPTIFKSIHEDLPDLQVPKWCSSPEEFISQHRKMLDSDFVSAKLHHWIDLTFGYKLSGSAAVKSKNIYLSLVDAHQNLEAHGVVQLFQTAHPPRKNPLRNLRNIVQYKDLKKLREQESLEDQPQETTPTDSKAKLWKNITLPKHYDPLGLLNDFEVTINFFKTHFPYLKDPGVELVGLKNRQQISHLVKLFGCLLLEIVLPQKFRHISSNSCVDEKFSFYSKTVKTCMTLVPLFCRRAVQAIFDRDSLEFSIPVDISLDLLLLGDKLGPIPFPFYFPEVHKMLRTMRNYEKVLATSAPNDSGYRLRLQELKVQSFSRDLLQILGNLDTEGIDLILPFVIEMFENPDTRVLAVWNLFCPVAKFIGRKKSTEFLLSPIVHIYESDYHSDKHLKLFHKTFLLQLSSCFGLRIFLEQFSTLLVEAIGGWKLSDQNECSIRAHLNSTDLEIDQTDEICTSQSKPLSHRDKATFKRCESEAGDVSSQNIEPEMFLMEPDLSDSESGCDLQQSTISSSENTNSTFPSVFLNESQVAVPGVTNTRSRNQSPHQSVRKRIRDSSTTRSGSVASVTGSVGSSRSVIDISDVCFESVISLAHRLGPVLTAKYFSKNLLRMLTLCYMDHIDVVESQNGLLKCDGDAHASKVLDCLIAISDLYGDAFVERQFIPYCVDIIRSARQKLTQTSESALIGVSTVLERIFQYIPDTHLMAQLQEPVIKGILQPIVDLVCSASTEFPSGGTPRALLASKSVSMMNSIRKKIGPDLAHLHLRSLVLSICKTFQSVYGKSDVKANFAGAFDSSLAAQIFTNFCDILTGSEYESLIRDLYLQEGLSSRNSELKGGSPTSEKSHQRRLLEQQSSFGSRSFGNRIQVQEVDTPSEDKETPSLARKDTTRHLRGNWLVYWEHEIGRSDSKLNFKQIKLHTFTGHSGSVRCIHALDNENSFLTASKDKTVKLFSLRNQGDESGVSSCQWTYSNHKKAVLSVLFNEPLHLAASTDGIIHIWDPFVGKIVRILEKGMPAKNSPICSLRPIIHTSYFVGAGIDSTIHVVDCRTCHAYELKIGIGQASGLVRCLAVSDNANTVSVGHSSGMLSTLDLRNGTLLGSWKGHDGEVLQLIPHRSKQLISSSFDQTISVWNLDDNRLAYTMRGPTEPVHSMCTFESELISCTTSNRIGIHCGMDSVSDFSSTRLRSDTFKGVVTSMRLLPLNQFLLLGSEAGNIVLLC